MKKVIYSITIVLVLISCNNSPKETKTQEKMKNEVKKPEQSLIGKNVKIEFPEMSAEVEYINNSTLHWKTIDSKGNVAEGNEKMDYLKLTDNLHFLNWIEKDGWTVSQIIDTKEGTVKAYWSFADEESLRGKRTSMFVDGTFEFVK